MEQDGGFTLMCSSGGFSSETNYPLFAVPPEHFSALQLFRTGLSYYHGPDLGVDVTDGSTDPDRPMATTVPVGQKVDLLVAASLAAPAPPAGQLYSTWTVQGDKVADFQPTTPASELSFYTTNEYSTDPSTSFAWTAGGTEEVTATVWSSPWGEHSVSATFNVEAPDATATATYSDKIAALPTPTPAILVGLFHSKAGGGTEQGMLWKANTPPGWQYCYAQVVNVDLTLVIPPQFNGAGKFGAAPPTAGLDTMFPYQPPGTQGVFQPGDSAEQGDRPATPLYPTGSAHLIFSAQTWYMAKPLGAAGYWVPVAVVDWKFDENLQWNVPGGLAGAATLTVNGTIVKNGSTKFLPTSQFPEWQAIFDPKNGYVPKK